MSRHKNPVPVLYLDLDGTVRKGGDRPEDRGCAEAANIDFVDAMEWRTGVHLKQIQTRK